MIDFDERVLCSYLHKFELGLGVGSSVAEVGYRTGTVDEEGLDFWVWMAPFCGCSL